MRNRLQTKQKLQRLHRGLTVNCPGGGLKYHIEISVPRLSYLDFYLKTNFQNVPGAKTFLLFR